MFNNKRVAALEARVLELETAIGHMLDANDIMIQTLLRHKSEISNLQEEFDA